MINLDALGAGAKLRNIYGPAWRYSHGDLEKEKVAEPVCDADIRCIILARLLTLATEDLTYFSSHRRPSLSQVHVLAGESRFHAPDQGTIPLDPNQTTPPCCLRPAGFVARLSGDEPAGILCRYSSAIRAFNLGIRLISTISVQAVRLACSNFCICPIEYVCWSCCIEAAR